MKVAAFFCQTSCVARVTQVSRLSRDLAVERQAALEGKLGEQARTDAVNGVNVGPVDVMDRQVEAARGHRSVDARLLPVFDEFACLVIPFVRQRHGAPGRLQGPADPLLQFGRGGARVGDDEETVEFEAAFDNQARHQSRDGSRLAGSGTRLDECQTCAIEGGASSGVDMLTPWPGATTDPPSPRSRDPWDDACPRQGRIRPC